MAQAPPSLFAAGDPDVVALPRPPTLNPAVPDTPTPMPYPDPLPAPPAGPVVTFADHLAYYSVQLLQTEHRGRIIVAARDLRAGEIVLRSMQYFCAVGSALCLSLVLDALLEMSTALACALDASSHHPSVCPSAVGAARRYSTESLFSTLTRARCFSARKPALWRASILQWSVRRYNSSVSMHRS